MALKNVSRFGSVSTVTRPWTNAEQSAAPDRGRLFGFARLAVWEAAPASQLRLFVRPYSLTCHSRQTNTVESGTLQIGEHPPICRVRSNQHLNKQIDKPPESHQEATRKPPEAIGWESTWHWHRWASTWQSVSRIKSELIHKPIDLASAPLASTW